MQFCAGAGGFAVLSMKILFSARQQFAPLCCGLGKEKLWRRDVHNQFSDFSGICHRGLRGTLLETWRPPFFRSGLVKSALPVSVTVTCIEIPWTLEPERGTRQRAGMVSCGGVARGKVASRTLCCDVSG